MRALVLGVVLLPSLVRAYDFAVDAETIGQAYQLRAADDALVNRRRLTQYLGLSVFNLGPRDPIGRPLPRNQFYLVASLRFDAELGAFATLAELPGRSRERELFAEKLDLLYAYLAGQDIAGFIDFRLGRQVLVDLYDWTSFDGLHVQARAPFYVAAEAWGGLAVTGASVLDSPVYRVDGTALGGNPLGSLGARQEEQLQPTFGLAARTDGLRDLSARFSYQRTVSETGDPRAPGERRWGVVDEKLGLSARGRLWSGRIVPWFAFRYDLVAGRLDEVYAGARAQFGRHGLSAEYVLAAPTFDGDSIWNVFASRSFDDVRAGYDLALGRLSLYTRAFLRLFYDDRGTAPSGGLTAAARLGVPRRYLRLDAYYEDGYGGRRAGVELATRLRLCGDALSRAQEGLYAEGRMSYSGFRDDARPLDRADSFGLQAGLRWTPRAGIALHGLVEENVNRLYTSQLRVLALLDLSFYLGQRPLGMRRPAAWSGF